MSEQPTLSTRVDAARAGTAREWELFIRTDPADPLTHAGSVTAPSIETARSEARALFDGRAIALWLCPAGHIERLQSNELSLQEGGDGNRAPEGTQS
jgi:rSAM-partnered protein